MFATLRHTTMPNPVTTLYATPCIVLPHIIINLSLESNLDPHLVVVPLFRRHLSRSPSVRCGLQPSPQGEMAPRPSDEKRSSHEVQLLVQDRVVRLRRSLLISCVCLLVRAYSSQPSSVYVRGASILSRAALRYSCDNQRRGGRRGEVEGVNKFGEQGPS